MEEKKDPPEANPEGQDTGKKDTGKSAEERLKEVEIERAELEKRIKHFENLEKLYGKQTEELGELRKKVEEIDKNKKTVEEDTSELEKEIIADLMKDGMDEDTAKYNAKLLAKMGNKIFTRGKKGEMMTEVIDLIDEALEENKLDKSAFKENENEIMKEFEGRKLAPTARRNFRIFRECYDIVIKRKADKMREEKAETDESKREAQIAEGAIPSSGTRTKEAEEEDEKRKRSIREADKRETDSVFF